MPASPEMSTILVTPGVWTDLMAPTRAARSASRPTTPLGGTSPARVGNQMPGLYLTWSPLSAGLEIEVRVVAQDGPFELTQRCARLDAQLFDQMGPQRLVDLQCFRPGGPNGTGRHPRRPEPLSQRVFPGHHLELAHQLSVVTGSETSFEPLFGGHHTGVIKAQGAGP